MKVEPQFISLHFMRSPFLFTTGNYCVIFEKKKNLCNNLVQSFRASIFKRVSKKSMRNRSITTLC